MNRQELWPATDPLGEALHLLRMTGSFYRLSELTSPWGMTLPAIEGCLWFHVVTSGTALLTVGDEPTRTLRPGELVLVPHGRGHELRDAPGSPVPPILSLRREIITERYEILRHGGGGSPTVMICGAVTFDHPAALDLVGALPPVMTVEAFGAGQTEWIRSTLQLMAIEAASLRPGGETVITRLADILVIQAIRAWLAGDATPGTGWLGALRDPQIGRAVAMIHRDPAHGWTVAALADAVAMSRSAFSARFTALVGEPAMRYVTGWRMRLAHAALAERRETVAEVAHRFGYESEAAFSRAFSRAMGVAPGAVRRGRSPRFDPFGDAIAAMAGPGSQSGIVPATSVD
ncbi:MAG TPA: AraC family transcriptional regulator [Thermomicrobiales bacterium]|jgi:AraC-like DNA-binding protein|nr:AraC family transcriptional regulator [Thermomicrobiales bacterium]